MESTNWNFFILFQYYRNDNEILYNLFTDEIKAINSQNNKISFYILKLIDDKKVEFYESFFSGKSKLDLREVSHKLQYIEDFYKYDVNTKTYKKALEVWNAFFGICTSKNENKNFIKIFGHGAGLGFTPRTIFEGSDKKRNSQIQQLTSILASNYINTSLFFEDLYNKQAHVPFFEKIFSESKIEFAFIPVSVFKDAINTSFKNKKIDFLCLANCFMQCVENAYILKDNVTYLIAPESSYKNAGLNLPELYSSLNKNDDEIKICKNIVSKIDARFSNSRIIEFYKALGENENDIPFHRNTFSISILQLSQMNDLKTKLNELSENILGQLKKDGNLRNNTFKIRNNGVNDNEPYCIDVAESFKPIGVIDLINFLSLINMQGQTLNLIENIPEFDTKTRNLCSQFINFTQQEIIITLKLSGISFLRYKNRVYGNTPFGISIFLPSNYSLNTENELVKFFIDNYIKKDAKLNNFLEKNAWKDLILYIYEYQDNEGFFSL